MGYKTFLNKRRKPLLYVEPTPSVEFKQSSWLGGILWGRGPGRRAIPKHHIIHYDYSPKPGLVPRSRAPFHSRLLTAGVVIAGLSAVWVLNEPSSAFYESSESNQIKHLSVPDVDRQLKKQLDELSAQTDYFMDHALGGVGAREKADSLLEPISVNEVLHAFSYPSNMAIELPEDRKNTPRSDSESSDPPDNHRLSMVFPGRLFPPERDAGKSLSELGEGWEAIQVKSGDNLSVIFDRHALNRGDLHRILELKDAAEHLRRLRPGQEIRIRKSPEGRLLELKLEISAAEELAIAGLKEEEQADLAYSAEILQRELQAKLVTASGRIRSSLYRDGAEAGLNDKLLRQMVAIFAWDIDFALDLQPGDYFNVVYEELYYQDKKVQTGNIQAVEFINSGTVFRAVRYAPEGMEARYYTPAGEGMETAFIRTPVKIGYVTSEFNLKRRHPILNKVRAHRGVDYGAPVGTPIFATGDGKVEHVGWKGGYGKSIILQHGDKYSTLYGHLSRYEKGVKVGKRVRQGELIGYVGQTGLATGPHLHYEFRVDGEHKNPLTVELPRSIGVSPEEKAEFMAASRPLLAQLDKLSEANLASAMLEQNPVPVQEKPVSGQN